MAVDPAYGSEPLSTSDDDLEATPDSAETTRRRSRGSAAVTSRPIPFSAEALRRPSSHRMAPGAMGSVTRGTAPFTPPLPAPILQTSDITPFGGEVPNRIAPSTSPLPPPSFIPTRQAPLPPAPDLQSVTGDENPSNDPPRERIPCLRCKEYSIDCHGPEIKLDGHCSSCHENRMRCEFKSHASNQNLNAPSSSSPNPPSFPVNDGMPHLIASTNNDYRTNINIPNPQPDTSSSSQQSYQKKPIIDESRERETSNTTGGITNDHSISSEPRIRPWWKRLFSRIFFSRKDRGAKRKRRS